MSFEISIKKFRNAVNRIEDQRDSVMIKTAYLLAARNCEILTKVIPADILRNQSKPYGTLMEYKFANYEVASETPDKEAVMEKAFITTMAVAKRGKRLRQPKEEEQTTLELQEAEVIEAFTKYGQTHMIDKWRKGEIEIDPMLIQILLGRVARRIVALPTSPKYEPWTKDLLRWILKTKGKLSFDLTRRRFTQIVRENLSGILPKVNKRNRRNPLRHYRLSHLSEYYNFNPMQLTNFAGWSIASTAKQMGMAASSNVDHYVHFRWQEYFPRLLKPLANFS